MTTKQIKRRVVAINVGVDRTQQGNPKDYFYVLECGHMVCESHSARQAVQAFVINLDTFSSPITKVCHQCMRKDPIHKKTLKIVLEGIKGKQINDRNLKDIARLYKETK
jgi:hypothetical protein